MLKNNVPAPSCIPPAGLEVLTRRYPIVPKEKNTRPAGLGMLKGLRTSGAKSPIDGGPSLVVTSRLRLASLQDAFDLGQVPGLKPCTWR